MVDAHFDLKGADMTEEPKTWKETIRVDGGQLLNKVRELVREGNVRHITISQDERVIVEFPLTIGVAGAVLAPMLVAVGAIAALVTNCSIDIEREAPKE